MFICLLAPLQTNEQTMAWTLNWGLPSSRFCVITWIGTGSGVKTLFCTWEKPNTAKLVLLCVKKTEMDRNRERQVVLRALSFEEKDLASACASLAWSAVNLLCKRVVCSMENIQFPLTCCFIPESYFLPSHLHLHNPWRVFCNSWKRYSLELTFFFLHECPRLERWRCLATLHIFKALEQKCTEGLLDSVSRAIREWGSEFLVKGEMWGSGETEDSCFFTFRPPPA